MKEKKAIANEALLQSDEAGKIISLIVSGAIRKYKMDADAIRQITVDAILKQPKLLQLFEQHLPVKKIARTHCFDEVNKKVKRLIYYELRKYNQDSQAQATLIKELEEVPPGSAPDVYQDIIAGLIESHVSTKERLPGAQTFYEELFKFIGENSTIIDIGCGMHPLLFPFLGLGKRVTMYSALDKDPVCIAALNAFSNILGNDILRPIEWNIEENWQKVIEKSGIGSFDIAFFMKLVPVVARQKPAFLDLLVKTPAQVWMITGSRNSMTKYKDIEKRERKIIQRFIDLAGKKEIIGEFSTADEFCLIVK